MELGGEGWCDTVDGHGGGGGGFDYDDNELELYFIFGLLGVG